MEVESTPNEPSSTEIRTPVTPPVEQSPAGPVVEKQPKTGFVRKYDEPLNKQLGGRCTPTEYARLKAIIEANGGGDIVRFALLAAHHAQHDIFSSIKIPKDARA